MFEGGLRAFGANPPYACLPYKLGGHGAEPVIGPRFARTRWRLCLPSACLFDAREKSGYDLARMSFEIVLAPEAVEDLKRLKAIVRATVWAALETHLRHEPEKASRSRIKRLRGLLRPQYRLRVDEVRVFYDVSGTTVEVLAIVPKSEAESWLAQFGNPE
jgi:mRNA interferase RelE/StbE